MLYIWDLLIREYLRLLLLILQLLLHQSLLNLVLINWLLLLGILNTRRVLLMLLLGQCQLERLLHGHLMHIRILIKSVGWNWCLLIIIEVSHLIILIILVKIWYLWMRFRIVIHLLELRIVFLQICVNLIGNCVVLVLIILQLSILRIVVFLAHI